jgi:hypothetical protein
METLKALGDAELSERTSKVCLVDAFVYRSVMPMQSSVLKSGAIYRLFASFTSTFLRARYEC